MKIWNKIIYLLLAGLVILQACSKEENQENEAPTCTITSPSNGQKFTLGDTISITVDANDQDGVLTEVEIFVDGALKKSLTDPPFSYQWQTLGEAAGKHVLKAKSFDDENAGSSDEIEIELKKRCFLV